ncbi:NTP transferase domain-containing protein [Cryobacterium sp. SO2]|uniref:molybdenum cofactor guanylyltransferase n=1 Tax=Cryobacterium sp. SO2 TaxID=1897060 RepID=UPI0023DAC286|nr:NTP transferase domain-containing protein [Cryobacterium sp. SO2]WEO78588.1 NTP transferase domain-containing protein [Cryobacterium sp. SO2]
MHTKAPSARRWDAIVVAGGRARRLGGIDKTALVWHGRSLLDGVLAAAAGARRICVVGSDAILPDSVLRTVERPRWGGPAAAIVAGLETLTGAAGADADADWVVVLAGDLVRPGEAVAALLAELDGQAADGVITVDAAGRRQPLLALYRRAALADAAAALGPAENLSVMSLIGGLTLHELHLPEALSDDVDTPADAARLGIEVPRLATVPDEHAGSGRAARPNEHPPTPLV